MASARAFACAFAAGISAARNDGEFVCAGSLQSGGFPNDFGPSESGPQREKKVGPTIGASTIVGSTRVLALGQTEEAVDAERRR